MFSVIFYSVGGIILVRPNLDTKVLLYVFAQACVNAFACKMHSFKEVTIAAVNFLTTISKLYYLHCPSQTVPGALFVPILEVVAEGMKWQVLSIGTKY